MNVWGITSAGLVSHHLHALKGCCLGQHAECNQPVLRVIGQSSDKVFELAGKVLMNKKYIHGE